MFVRYKWSRPVGIATSSSYPIVVSVWNALTRTIIFVMYSCVEFLYKFRIHCQVTLNLIYRPPLVKS